VFCGSGIELWAGSEGVAYSLGIGGIEEEMVKIVGEGRERLMIELVKKKQSLTVLNPG